MDTHTFTVQGHEYTVVRMPAKDDWPEGSRFSHGAGPEEFEHISAAGLEILRLAEENAELRKIIERDGDIRRVAPVLDAALKERDRLAEEVGRCRCDHRTEVEQLRERLAQVGHPPDRVLEAVKAAERARIRRELLEWLSGPDCAIEDWRDHTDLRSALDRVCPG